jgi:hypothetical protein
LGSGSSRCTSPEARLLAKSGVTSKTRIDEAIRWAREVGEWRALHVLHAEDVAAIDPWLVGTTLVDLGVAIIAGATGNPFRSHGEPAA